MANIEFEGLKELDKKLSKMLSVEDLEKALGKACAVVERSAKEKAPKGKTGDLRKFITSRIEMQNGVPVGIVFSPLEYAPYVEYGTGLFAEEGGRQDVPWAYEDEETGELIWTSGQKPHPFMRPALNENREKIKRILKESISDD